MTEERERFHFMSARHKDALMMWHGLRLCVGPSFCVALHAPKQPMQFLAGGGKKHPPSKNRSFKTAPPTSNQSLNDLNFPYTYKQLKESQFQLN